MNFFAPTVVAPNGALPEELFDGRVLLVGAVWRVLPPAELPDLGGDGAGLLEVEGVAVEVEAGVLPGEVDVLDEEGEEGDGDALPVVRRRLRPRDGSVERRAVRAEVAASRRGTIQ